MMSEHDLTDVVQIAVDDLTHDQAEVLENQKPEHGIVEPTLKRKRVEVSNGHPSQDATIKSILFDINQAICLRLDSIEAKIQAVEATCKAIEEKIDLALNKQNSPIQVPMVAGSPLGATQTWNKVRSTVPQMTVILNRDRQNPASSKVAGQDEHLNRGTDALDSVLNNSSTGRRQNTIIVKIPGHEDSHTEDVESGSETSDTVSNSGQSGGQNLASNVTLITLNSEEDYPNGTWLGDENNAEMRVRSPITAADMLHVATVCRTAEKMALTLLDYLFHREIQAVSNLSGQGKHGKKQLDPLMIYGIRCHLFHNFGITESDWYRIKQSIDSKCRTAWRRKQRGQSLAVKGFARRTPSSSVMNGTEGGIQGSMSPEDLQQSQSQTLHYALANAQQVHIHRIGEDGQVQQVAVQGHLHIAQVPQGEQVQITQDSEGNLQIHQVHVSQDGQVLQGAQLIAVASEHPASTVDGSPLQGNDIQVQYVQLAPVTDHNTPAQGTESLAATIQPELQIEHGAIQIQQGENGEVVQIQMPVNTVSS
ncbi:protein BANP [Callorhinchus milii]|uniref:Protein BANP n=1 Tax=Callorhinchus milii TaxID=7868 RepID=V9KKX7_CALMI|nr:protein BANP [Callorhinchus milii]|eukprot:gi/632944512/ref/XP_007887549.1/ PREDICTED: protein BANP [Callorhinchus milii]